VRLEVAGLGLAGARDITISTDVLTDQIAYRQASAGIVADSVPARGTEATLPQAAAAIRALVAVQELQNIKAETSDYMTTQQLTEPDKQATGLSRSLTVLILLLGGVLALIGATQTWVAATGFEATRIQNVQLSGQEAAPVITAMAFVTVVAGAALSIVRTVGRWVIGIVAILATVMMGWATINVMVNPLGAAAQKIAETTGTSGVAGDTAATIEVSLLPWLTVIGSGIGLVGALIALTVGASWPVGKTKKYDIGVQRPTAQKADGRLDEIDTWDELSRGEDPT